MTRFGYVVAAVVLVAACAPAKEGVDSSAALPVDTLKAADPVVSAVDSPAADSTPATKTTSASKTKSGATKAADTKGREPNELGRDSIIRVDTKDKRRQLPPADTNRKP